MKTKLEAKKIILATEVVLVAQLITTFLEVALALARRQNLKVHGIHMIGHILLTAI